MKFVERPSQAYRNINDHEETRIRRVKPSDKRNVSGRLGSYKDMESSGKELATQGLKVNTSYR